MTKKLLIALGGNALLRAGEKGTAEEQINHAKETAKSTARLIEKNYKIVLTHGNGPQIGNILLKDEMTAKSFPEMPMDICGAQTQGMIGYLLQRTLKNKLLEHKIDKDVFTICTQTLVDKNDPAFENPTKPVGRFYSQEQSKDLQTTKGWQMVEQIGKGFRRVVPSPVPIDIIEAKSIKKSFENGFVVIACGGGGVPVIKNNEGQLIGIEAVIDKDLTGAVLAELIGVDIFIILTDVENVAINFGKPNQENLTNLTLKQANEYLDKGEFAKGSMGPKVKAACRFVEKGGKKAIITSLEKCLEALEGKTGTSIEK